MKTKTLFVLVGFLIGASLAACARSQGEINTQAIEHFDRGVENQQQGNFDLAIEEFTEAIVLDPSHARAYTLRGRAYYFKGDLDQAIADFDQAIDLDPQDTVAYNNRGNAYDDKGDFDQAIADYDQAIELDPQYDLKF